MSDDDEPETGVLGLEEGEVAIVLKDVDDDVVTRLVVPTEGDPEAPVAFSVQLAVALLTRLQEDEDFAEDILAWYDEWMEDQEDE